MLVLNLLCFLLVGFELCSGARQLLEINQDLFIATQNPSAFDPNLNLAMAMAHSSAQNLKEIPDKTVVGCEDGNSAMNNLSFRFKEDRSGGDRNNESSVQRLSKSTPSPGVGHMQIFKIAKSGQSGSGVDKKRVLESTPSPGG
ncbi:hypothetical protein KI387_001770, partial [Taxus chinensis]